MRDEYHRFVARKVGDLPIQLVFRRRVERCGRLIHYNYVAVGGYGARNGDLLRLSARKAGAALVKFAGQRGVYPLLHRGESAVKARAVQRVEHTLPLRVGVGVGENVLRERCREQPIALKDGAYTLPIAAYLELLRGSAVVQYAPRIGAVQPHDKIDEGGFPRSVAADERYLFAAPELHRNAAQHLAALRVCKMHVAQLERFKRRRILRRAARLGDIAHGTACFGGFGYVGFGAVGLLPVGFLPEGFLHLGYLYL